MTRKTADAYDVFRCETQFDRINTIAQITNLVLKDSCATESEIIKIRTYVEDLQDTLWSVLGKDSFRAKGLL